MKKRAILMTALSCLLWTSTGTYAANNQAPLHVAGAALAQSETLEFENGDIYTGQVKNDLMHGKGTYKFRDGSHYVGAFVDNYFSGKGKLTLFNGVVYEGDFKDDDYNGQGKLKDFSGTYVGAFKNGLKEGKGKFFSNLGYVLEGTFKEDAIHGQVSLSLGKDLIIKGKIQSGEFVGKVSVLYKGKSYVADFTKKDRVVLTSDLIIEKGVTIYRGPVKKGLLNGNGTITMLDSKVTAKFVNEEATTLTMDFSVGYQFKGSFSEVGIQKGTIKAVKGDVFNVEFVDGWYHVSGNLKIKGKPRKIDYYISDGEIKDFTLDGKAVELEGVSENKINKIFLYSEDEVIELFNEQIVIL